MSDDERTMRHMLGHPPGTVTLGKPEERADGVTVWPFIFIAKRGIEAGEPVYFGKDVVEYWPRIETYQLVGDSEPVATPTVVGIREGTR